jgi:hypothetical protein
LKRLCVMTNIYAIQELEAGDAKGKVNWVWLTMHELRLLIGSFDFHNHQETTHTRFHEFKSIDLFCTSMITNYMIRSRLQDIFKWSI